MPSSSPDPYETLEREPRSSAWGWLGYLVLYAIAIPWYWPVGFRVGQIDLRRWRKGDVVLDRGEIHALEPSYLRPSEAERRLAEKSTRGS